MSKELSPLEALEKIKKLGGRIGILDIKEEEQNIFPNPNIKEPSCLDIIEKALREQQERIEELEETNHLMFLREHKNEKKLKALEIIKEKQIDFHIFLISVNCKHYNFMIDNKDRYLTQEEFDLLKEVLK